jgi:hypothetical protein
LKFNFIFFVFINPTYCEFIDYFEHLMQFIYTHIYIICLLRVFSLIIYLKSTNYKKNLIYQSKNSCFVCCVLCLCVFLFKNRKNYFNFLLQQIIISKKTKNEMKYIFFSYLYFNEKFTKISIYYIHYIYLYMFFYI